MECTLTSINWLSALTASLASFAIGSLWYSPLLFNKVWSKEVGLDEEKMKSANMPIIFGLTFVLQFVAAIALDWVIGPTATISKGLGVGVFVALAWIATAFATQYLFTQKSLRLFLIDAGYYFVLYGVMGVILGAW